MSTNDLKNKISDSLKGFAALSLRQASGAFLKTLGYTSGKTIELDGSPAEFIEQFNQQPEITKFTETIVHALTSCHSGLILPASMNHTFNL